MKIHQKIASATALAVIGLFEIAERADFVQSHLPTWLTTHSDLTAICLLIGICLYLIATHGQVEQQGASVSSPPISNTSTGGAATATAEGGRIEQHIHFPSGMTHPQSPNQADSKHNVQCLGLTQINGMLALCFENVLIPNEQVAEFRSARLKVIYYNHPSGEEILEVFPARWSNTGEARVNIGANKMYAEIATCGGVTAPTSESRWKAHQVIETKTEPNGTLIRFLPLGTMRIVATLIGEGNLSIAPVTGILTLEKDGSATFDGPNA